MNTYTRAVLGCAYVVLVLGSVFVPRTWGQAPPTNGLVAFYPFNGNANDQTGSGINGTVSNAVLVADRFGHTNAAYFFNGTNSQITFSSVPVVPPTLWTLSAWVNPASTNQLGTAVTVGYDDGRPTVANGFSFGIAGNQGSSSGGELYGVVGADPWQWGNSGFTFPAANRWYHVAMMDAGGWLVFYVNGLPTAAGLIGLTWPPRLPTAFTIGSATGVRFFNGAVDDVRIYNTSLSSSEVQQLYQYESQPCVTRGATATARVVNGFVVQIDITEEGCGYTNEPAITIVGGGGSGATAVAHVNNGMLTSFSVTSAGFGYTNTPTVWIASPPFLPSVLSIGVSAVKVAMRVWPGNNYVLESSTDLQTWIATGPPFIAQSNLVVQEFQTTDVGRFFRIRQIP
ncbi:MAG TPA: LamG domain-containing protein [Verrucomicrobiae bacterium]